MLLAEARIAARHLALEPLVHAERNVDTDISVGVRPDLPSGGVRFPRVGVKLFFGHHLNAEIIRRPS
jgi:hypothetical protein